MIIVVAGIKRSGSTAQFNMIRLICEYYYGTERVRITGVPKKALELNNPDTVVICKYHPFDRKLYERADFIFTTSRPLTEIKESMLRFYGEGNLPKRSLKAMQSHLVSWQRGSFNHTFMEIVKNPRKCIRDILGYIGFEEDITEEILYQFKGVKPPKEGYDNRTLLFSNHITK